MELKRFDGYFITQDERGYGNVLALTQPWDSSYIAAIKRHDVRIIRLSEYGGWLESDVGFLSEVPFIEGVEIISDKVTDLRPIDNLRRLRKVSLTCPARTPVDFSTFGRMEDIFLSWRNGYRSVFCLRTLKRINIVDYPQRDLTIWKENDQLRDLLLQSKTLESLAGIESFRNVRTLDLFRCRKLNSLKYLSAAACIRKFELDQCPGINDISEISKLTELRDLIIHDCGEIKSLSPIRHCRSLEILQVGGNTTITDGEIGVLETLPKLKRVLLAHRKHYRNFPRKFESREF